MKLFSCVLVLSIAAVGQSSEADPHIVLFHGKYGYIRADGSFAIRPKYAYARGFEDGKATVFICGTAVSIDAEEKISSIETPELTSRHPFVSNATQTKVGFVDRGGNFVIPPAYDEVWEFSDGLAAVSVDDKWGYVDKAGKLVIPMIFDSPGYFANGRALVGTGDLIALIDKQGNVLSDGFTETNYLPPGKLTAVAMNDGWGYIDLDGRTVVPFRYEKAQDFKDGVAAVSRKGKWGFINERGTLVIPYKFDKVERFSEGLAWAKVGNKTGYINKRGRFEFLLESENGNDFDASGVASFFTKNWKQFGYVNRQGHVVWGPTPESPSHPPLFGWSQEEIDESCKGFSAATKTEVEKIKLSYR